MHVEGKTVVVTGGAGGLGSAMGRLLAEQGARVMLLDLDGEQGEALAREIRDGGGDATFFPIDLTQEAAWAATLKEILGKTGRIDVLVNNAGINIRKPVTEMAWDEWETMMRINVGSVFLGTKHVLPVMQAQGAGAIINTSSVCGLIGHRYTTEAYTATKGAVTQLTRSIAARYAGDGIRCNCICPSTVDTPFVQIMFQDPQKKRERLEEIPLGRLATAQDVAWAVLYLASDEASFINGVALPVDGGLTAY